MTCKECIHYEVCDWHRAYEGYADLFGAERCDYYQPKSRFVELPCEVGQTVYQCDGVRIYESTIRQIVYDTNTIAFDERAIGKTVFLSREEAEKALKRGVKMNWKKMNWFDVILSAWGTVISIIVLILLIFTAPILAIPYVIYKKVKERSKK